LFDTMMNMDVQMADKLAEIFFPGLSYICVQAFQYPPHVIIFVQEPIPIMGSLYMSVHPIS
jgi:hypothetical protein